MSSGAYLASAVETSLCFKVGQWSLRDISICQEWSV